MHRFSILYLSIHVAIHSCAQYKLPQKFIPEGFSIMAQASGDINQDGLSDKVLVLRNKYEKMNTDTTRPLLILFGNGSGKYRLFARNDRVVLCYGCGGVHGDPFLGVLVRGGMFMVRHFGGSGWRWTRDIEFRYNKQEQALILEEDRGWSWQINDPKKRSKVIYRTENVGRLFQKYSNNTDAQ